MMISPIRTPELAVAEEAARAGGRVVTRYFHEGITMRNKDVANLVSDADIESERAIVAVIREAFPDHEVLAEERTPATSAPNTSGSLTRWTARITLCTRTALRRLGRLLPRGAGRVRDRVQPDARRVARRGARAGCLPGRTSGEGLRRDFPRPGADRVGFDYNRGALMEATLEAIGDLKRSAIHGIRRFGTASLDSAWSAWGCSAPISSWSSRRGTSRRGVCSSRRAAGASPPAFGRSASDGKDRHPRLQRPAP